MALSVLDDKSQQPDAKTLKKVLGESASFWYEVISFVSEAYPPITEQWNYTSSKYGWSLRLKQKDRIVLYLTPQIGSFLAGVVLGEKAAQAAHAGNLPDAVLKVIDDAPCYAEGRGIRFPVAVAEAIEVVRELVKLKMATNR